MRILHTSDWHIGRTFHGVDLLSEQAVALRALADIVASRAVDVVVVAGDVYDRSVPGADAIRVCQDAFEAIRDAGAELVVTSGNHDSPARLGAGASFAARGGLHLVTRVSEIGRPVVVERDETRVAVYGIPYLEPDVCRAELGVPAARSHTEVLGAALARVRADAAERDCRTVVAAHAFVVGAEAAGSERSIAVGGVETVPCSLFDGIDYVALGHLHGPQTVAPHVRYSGSPLPYSFSESAEHKSAWLVDVPQVGELVVERVGLPVVRGLSTLTGTLDDLLSDIRYEYAVDHFVSARLTDATRPLDAMRTLRERFVHAVHVEWVPPERSEVGDYRARTRNRSDLELAVDFVTTVRSEPSASERKWLDDGVRAADRAIGIGDETVSGVDGSSSTATDGSVEQAESA